MWNICVKGGLSHQKEEGVGNRDWDGNMDPVFLRKSRGGSRSEEWERKRRHGLTQLPWTFLTCWHLFPLLSHAYYFSPDCTWPQRRTSFPSLSVQAHGWGKLIPSLCSSVLAPVGPHGSTTALVSLSPVALSPALHLFLWRATRDFFLHGKSILSRYYLVPRTQYFFAFPFAFAAYLLIDSRCCSVGTHGKTPWCLIICCSVQ